MHPLSRPFRLAAGFGNILSGPDDDDNIALRRGSAEGMSDDTDTGGCVCVM